MNGKKSPKTVIEKNRAFFQSLSACKGVCIMGLSYNSIDVPYLNEIAANVAPDCKWLLYYYSEEDKKRAEEFAKDKGLVGYMIKRLD